MAILITGASSGFGAAICETLVQAGYFVLGAARRENKLLVLREKLGESFQPLVMDICHQTSIDKALSDIATLPEQFRTIDGLVNNASLALGLDKAYETDFADWERMIQTNQYCGLNLFNTPSFTANGCESSRLYHQYWLDCGELSLSRWQCLWGEQSLCASI